MITNPTPADLAEAELARHLRGLGMSRLAAMARAEAHGDRLSVDRNGTITARLANGARVSGDAGVEALAREITHFPALPPNDREPPEPPMPDIGEDGEILTEDGVPLTE